MKIPEKPKLNKKDIIIKVVIAVVIIGLCFLIGVLTDSY